LVVTFNDATYQMAQTCSSLTTSPCDDSPVDTLTVTVAGGVAQFSITGADTASFDLPSTLLSAGSYGGAPYFLPSQYSDETWSSSVYPYITLYPSIDGGGLTIGSAYTDGVVGEAIFIDTYDSNAVDGASDFYSTQVPEAPVWAMMIVGSGGLGAVMRRRRRSAAAA
jgi:hypothetical protein